MNAGLTLLDRIVTYVIDPAVKVIFTLGFFFFVWGVVRYLNEVREGKAEGERRMHLIWGIVGMLIMVTAYGIIGLVMNTFGITPGNATDISRLNAIQPSQGFFTR